MPNLKVLSWDSGFWLDGNFWFVYLFICSFVYSFIYLFIYLFIFQQLKTTFAFWKTKIIPNNPYRSLAISTIEITKFRINVWLASTIIYYIECWFLWLSFRLVVSSSKKKKPYFQFDCTTKKNYKIMSQL